MSWRWCKNAFFVVMNTVGVHSPLQLQQILKRHTHEKKNKPLGIFKVGCSTQDDVLSFIWVSADPGHWQQKRWLKKGEASLKRVFLLRHYREMKFHIPTAAAPLWQWYILSYPTLSHPMVCECVHTFEGTRHGKNHDFFTSS